MEEEKIDLGGFRVGFCCVLVTIGFAVAAEDIVTSVEIS